MHRCGSLERGEPLVGEDGEQPAAVLGAHLPAHPAALLQPGHRVRQPAAGGQAPVGQLAHPHHPVGRFGEGDQDLVVGVRDAGLVGELAVERVLQQQRAVQPGTPGLLLLGVQPARLRDGRRPGRRPGPVVPLRTHALRILAE